MNRNQAKELLPIIKAFSEGKTIQYKNLEGIWEDVDNNHNCVFLPDSYEYRIRPESTCRPFKNAEECWQEMQKHQPFGWVKYQCSFYYIVYIEDKMIGYGSACGTILHDNFNDALRGLTFVDGTSFGIKIEE